MTRVAGIDNEEIVILQGGLAWKGNTNAKWREVQNFYSLNFSPGSHEGEHGPGYSIKHSQSWGLNIYAIPIHCRMYIAQLQCYTCCHGVGGGKEISGFLNLLSSAVRMVWWKAKIASLIHRCIPDGSLLGLMELSIGWKKKSRILQCCWKFGDILCLN